MSKLHCDKCGKMHDDGATKCDCGGTPTKARLDGHCPKCGSTMASGADKCDSCGAFSKGNKSAARKDSANYIETDVLRVDYTYGGFTPDNDEEAKNWGLVKAMVRNDMGFMQGKSPVTNIGVFTYRRADGTIRRELRLPEEVFNRDSLASLAGIPITANHPAVGRVTPENIKDLAIGNVGDRIDTDSLRVYAPITITHKSGQDFIDAGNRGLSLGYRCDIEERSGKFLGSEYDAIQRNIRYNHLAVVSDPRAGEDAFIRMDGENWTLDASVPSFSISKQQGQVPHPTTSNKEPIMDLKQIRLDGVEYQAEAKVIESYTKEKERADAAEKLVDATKAEVKKVSDEAQARLDAAETEKKDLKTRLDAADAELPAKIAAGVKARLKITGALSAAKVEFKEDASDDELKILAIQAVSPEFKLDGRSSDYLNARFDAACETLEARTEGDVGARRHVGETRVDGEGEIRQDAAPGTAAKARERMIASYGKPASDAAA